MLRRALSIFVLLSAAAISLACSCVWFETQEALQDLFDESDVVLTGYAVRNLTPGPHDQSTETYVGHNVLLKVVRVYKGQPRADSAFVLQEAAGNCAEFFGWQDTVLIFGHRVRAVRRAPRSNTRRYDPGMQDSTAIYYSARRSPRHRLFRRLHARYFTFITSQCICFDPHHELIADFIRAKTQSRP